LKPFWRKERDKQKESKNTRKSTIRQNIQKLIQKPEQKQEIVRDYKKLAERRVWYFYLNRSADFLEQKKEKISSLIEKFMSEEKKKRNLDDETEKLFCGYATADIEIRIIEYKATFKAYEKNPRTLETYLKIAEMIKFDEKLIYDCNTGDEYKQILFDIMKKKEVKEKDEAIIEFLVKKYKAFPCNCLLHEPKNLNYLPSFVAAKAIDKTIKDFYSVIDITE